jgi:DNA-binding transcriptional MerR regulator
MLRSNAMTIGRLSRRSGVPIKVLRDYEDLGFLYTLGRSESNYRLFGEEALWCVQVIQGLRSLGLTLKEIQALVTCYLERPGEPSSVLLEAQLAQAPKDSGRVPGLRYPDRFRRPAPFPRRAAGWQGLR